MSVPQISLRAARHLHLAAQGLLHNPRRVARPADILSTISRMSLLQIDTINIVSRSPYLVLFSRLGSYPPSWLDESLARQELIEYWAHEACFLPRDDFALIRHRMLQPELLGWKYNAAWMKQHALEINQLLEYIGEHGPVRSADFSHPAKSGSGWWAWKPYKKHLEGLFSAGQLMVVARHNFQRLYDLTSKVMPSWDERDALSVPHAQHRMLQNSARSLGIYRPEWLADYYRLRRVSAKALVLKWAEQGDAIAVQVEQLGEMWLDKSLLPLLNQAQQNRLNATRSVVLSPFDPVVWDRKRAEILFNFCYRLECYTPTAKRQYGYFVLPLLHRGALVGRMDAKMHRKLHLLEIISLHLECGIKPTASLINGLQSALSEFALW